MGILKSSLLAVSLLAIGGSASALTTISSYTFAPESTDFTAAGSVSGFDRTLGTLTGVTISFSYNENFNGTVTNSSPGAQTFKIIEDTGATFGFGSDSITGSDNYSQRYNGLAAHATAPFGPHTTNVTNSKAVFDFSAYEVAAVPVTLSTLTSTTTLGGGGNIQNEITTTAGGTATVTYSYSTGAPEPAAWALMIVGFAFSGAALRHGRRSATA